MLPISRRHIPFLIGRILILAAVLLCSGCYLLTPEDPPREVRELYPEDFAWDYIDIAREYEFIGVPRIDCILLESYLKKTGHCEPKKLPFAPVLECPLVFPAKTLEFACIPGIETPAVYARLTWDDSVHVDAWSSLGKCRMAGAGPANDEPERYPTDVGFKACLFEDAKTPGQLLGIEGAQRPAGLLLDLSQNPKPLEELDKMTRLMTVDAPVSLVLDTQLFPEDQRAPALDTLIGFFKVYRKMPVINTMKATE